MSDGLRLLSATVAAGSIGAIISMDEAMFIEGPEREALSFIKQHYRRYRELPDTSTVQTEANVRLPTAPEPLAFYVDRVYERHEYNQIRDRFGALRDGLQQRDMPAVNTAVAEMHRVSRLRNRRGLESMNIREAVGLVEARLDATQGYGGITGVETGWEGYDHITGGYQDADLISLVGRMGTGKTYIALRQAQQAHERGENVLFVTTEMGIEQIGRRHVSVAMGINPQVLKLNTVSSYTRRRIGRFYSEMAGTERFNIFSVGMNSTVSAIEAFMQEYGPSIVFIDGIYLLKPNGGSKSMNRTEKITNVYDEVKALNLEANVPMVATTQFSRQAGKGGADGSLENIGYSDAIGTHSSIVVGIKFGPTPNPKHSRFLEFLKGREGEDGRVAINFKFAPLDMSEFHHEENPAAPAAAVTGEQAATVDWMSR